MGRGLVSRVLVVVRIIRACAAIFGTIIDRINDLLRAPVATTAQKGNWIGLLDIFGFEHFDRGFPRNGWRTGRVGFREEGGGATAGTTQILNELEITVAQVSMPEKFASKSCSLFPSKPDPLLLGNGNTDPDLGSFPEGPAFERNSFEQLYSVRE